MNPWKIFLSVQFDLKIKHKQKDYCNIPNFFKPERGVILFCFVFFLHLVCQLLSSSQSDIFFFFFLFQETMMFFLLLLLGLVAGARITTNPATTTFSFTQSIANFQVWTAPNARRIRSTSTAPAATGNTLQVFCAREELESFQVGEVFFFFFFFFVYFFF